MNKRRYDTICWSENTKKKVVRFGRNKFRDYKFVLSKSVEYLVERGLEYEKKNNSNKDKK